jgi:LPS O-antigen subunit length determinant protein (WzzB/FepE family)
MAALITATVCLFGVIAYHRLHLWRTRRDEYIKAYTVFSEVFDHTINQIKTEGTTLNLLILGEFPKHDEAMSKFIGYLKGKRRRQFQEKWNEYKEEYQKLKNLGSAWVAATAAIIPSPDSPTSPQDLDRYEKERSQYIFNLIHDILEIAKIKSRL